MLRLKASVGSISLLSRWSKSKFFTIPVREQQFSHLAHRNVECCSNSAIAALWFVLREQLQSEGDIVLLARVEATPPSTDSYDGAARPEPASLERVAKELRIGDKGENPCTGFLCGF